MRCTYDNTYHALKYFGLDIFSNIYMKPFQAEFFISIYGIIKSWKK